MSNKIHDAFDQIEASQELKNSTMQYLRAEYEKQSVRTSRLSGRKVFAAICAMFFLLVGAGGYYTVNRPVSYVSIDVNPSIELALNCFDRVISAAAFNEDAENVIEGVDVKGKLYKEAIDLVIGSKAMQQYLDKSNMPVFTVASKDTAKKLLLLTGIGNCHSYIEYGGKNYSADIGLVSDAHDHGMSFGKYAAYLVLAQYDETVTVQDCHHMSIAEIYCQIDEHESGSKHESDSKPEKEGRQESNGSESDCDAKKKDESKSDESDRSSDGSGIEDMDVQSSGHHEEPATGHHNGHGHH